MLARTTKIVHKGTGSTLDTPLLVPSFSSKGSLMDKEGKPEINSILTFASEFITKTCLISAYDLNYQYIEPPDKIPLNLDIIFLDSGGYEVSWDYDYSSAIVGEPSDKPWELSMYEDVLSKWPETFPAVFVNFDHPDYRKPLKEQISEARDLFRSHKNQLHLFLLKPETKDQATLREVLKKVHVDIGELALFDIVGVTEKELGSSMLERMKELGNLRLSMDRAGIRAPIHVFGALDPVTVFLYFIAGAEIFDGLTWIRYAYNIGQCVYIHNHGALNYGLHTRDNQVKLRTMTDNIYELERLERAMREYITTGDYSKFSPHADFVKKAIDSLSTELGGGVI